MNVLDMTALKRAILKGNYDTKGDCDADGDLDYDDVVWLQDFLLTEVKSYPAYDTIDTDLDGLSDYAEVEYSNTSPTKADTDGDGINDYYEYAFLETDPNTADTNITNADPDKDGLTNLEEQKYGTNPQNADSDNDGFNDSDEIKKHGTDPTKEDTDGDGLTDWDELVDMSEFSLDPNKASTNGTPDGKRVFTQHISADDEMLSAINTDDNAYSLSLDINASGNAKKCISVVESGYTNYMKNGAAIGAVPEITYDDDYTLKDITLKYEIKEDFRESVIDLFTDNYTYDESLAGIKRLNVFKFFEEIDEEMPIDTSYDEDNNIVYVTLTNDSFESSDVVDGINVGSFSLVDLEVWGALMNEHLEEASDENAKIPSSSLPPSNQNAQMSRGYTASVAADDSFIGPPKPDRSNWEQNSKIFKNYLSSRVRSQETDISTPVCYGGHYYAVVLANVGWSDAEVRCEALGGHLMTPATAGEFALMQGCLAPGNTTNHYWIGAHLVGGSWQWVNDEGTVTYIDTVPKKYVSGRYYGLSDYGRYISTELYYADGMSYYPFTSNPQIGYIIEWDSLSDYINGTSADSSYSIATLIKSMRGNVCLKSPLTKGSAVDSDGDGVPDYDELNLKLLKKVYGTTTPTKMVVSISTIIRALATKNTTSYTLVKKGTIAEKIETALKTTSSTVTGTTSIINTEYAYWNEDPMASDMDCDYLPDGEDSHKKRFDATPIDAALIDDSSMFTNRDNNKFYSIKAYSDKSTPTTTANEILVNADQKGGGSPSIMEMPENLKKIAITYNRNTNYNQDGRIEFCINAEDFHDYVFEISFDNASDAQAALNANSFMKVYSGTNPWKVQKELSADKKNTGMPNI